MSVYHLDGKDMTSRAAAYRVIRQAMGFPEWSGRNLDALADCLGELDPADAVEFVNTGALTARLGPYGEKILACFRDMSEEVGFPLTEWEAEPPARRFAVVSGFLGAGKTSVMMALTKRWSERFAPAAMISNDLGSGVTLADHRFAALSGARAAEITDECICFCRDVLTARLREFFSAGCELVLSDIPGFGVGALEHVYHGLAREGLRDFELAPFTVVVEPRRAALLRDGGGGDMAYILRAQLMEADLIVLNKCDLIDAAEAEALAAYLAGEFPEARVLRVSAATGEGLDALADALRDGRASMRHPAIDYRGAGLRGAMGKLSEYYLQYRAVVCCDDFDGTAYLSDLAGRAREGFREIGAEIPHLKLLAWGPEGDFGKVDLLGADRPPEITRPFERRCTDLAVVLNAGAVCPSAALDSVLTEAAEAVSKEYQLELMVFRKDCFGMGG